MPANSPISPPSPQSQGVDRRTFLKLLSMAAAMPVVQTDGAERAGKRVVVLGAGLAGLASAWNLVNRGYDVTVLEAQSMAGGRVKTIREPFQKGGYAEAGAVRIPENHRWTMKYIRLMGLESKLRVYDESGTHLWYLRGKRFTTPRGEWPLEGLTPRERRNPFAMVPVYWDEGFKAVGDPTSPEFPTEGARALDAVNIEQYFRQRGASEAWIRLVLASEGDASRINAVAVTAMERTLIGDGPTRMYGLVGGNDQLPRALAAALGSRVRYGSAVIRLAHTSDRITLTVRDASGGQHELIAEHCVCAIPFPVLRRIDITPAFSAAKMDALHHYDLAPSARVSFQTRTQFWSDDPLGPLGGLNMIGTDTPAERIWNTSELQPDPTMGMLHAYMIDRRALNLAAVPDAKRVAATLDAISPFLPRLRDEVVATCVKVWQEDPWIGGAFGFLQPGQYLRLWPAARRPEGRIHFAGEHTSVWVGWQNGALESAERCVHEIVGHRRDDRDN